MEREHMSPDLRHRYEPVEISYVMGRIHLPADQTELLFARRRLAFDKFFMFLAGIRRPKKHREDRHSAFMVKEAEEVTVFQSSLPYALTGAQERVLGEICDGMESGLVMNRLVQGDVGSDKIITAILALLQAIYDGYQGALMVPTGVLARQHFESITNLSEKQGIEKVPVLTTGSMTAKEKCLAYAKVASHEAGATTGTHVLIQEKVVCDSLALVITDERRRLGMEQRKLPSSKGQEPHVLAMSATPIPCTLVIILCGDLDISTIDELPAGRQIIKDHAMDPGYRPRAYTFIERQVAGDHQVYVICLMMKESEAIEAESVLDCIKALKKALPSPVIVEYLHDKMRGKGKDVLIEHLAAGEIHVLVPTIIVEVGVNMPDATVMMIENTERFGLAQLHQLRGRAGGGKDQSYCIMINCSRDEGAGEHLDILNRSSDRFYIVSKDLKLRGPGDIFGLRQSGDIESKLVSIFTDTNILEKVSEKMDRLLDTDPGLEKDEHGELKRKVEEYLGTNHEKLDLQRILYEQSY